MQHIIKTIKPGITTNYTSYWAMHIGALIETLYEHSGLRFNLNRYMDSRLNNYNRSLRGICDAAEPFFFNQLIGHIRNWGLQYFMCHYLRCYEGYPVLLTLRDALANNLRCPALSTYQEIGIYVGGRDSISGMAFIKGLQKRCSTYWRYNRCIQFAHGHPADFNNSDLCMVFDDSPENYAECAVFGEVEGKPNKGFTIGYFSEKPAATNFTIGVRSQSDAVELHHLRASDRWVPVIYLGSDHNVMQNYEHVINLFRYYFAERTPMRTPLPIGLKEVFEIVREHWDADVTIIIELLRDMFDLSDIASPNTNQVSTHISLPKLIT